MQILRDRGGELPGREVISAIEQTLDLDDWARSTYEKSGYTRWISILHFYSIDMIKAGYMLKRKGVWYLTKEGVAALDLGEIGMLQSALAKYKEWREENPREKREKSSDEDLEEVDVSQGEQGQEATLQEVEQRAADGIRQRIDSINAYEFQDLVAALLRGMKYYTPFIAPRGKDGGVDIIAYQDPLGAVSPRSKVQIKHRDSSASVQEIRELIGLLSKDGDVGMFVSTGGFTSDAKIQARNSHVHVELVDLDRFIALWQEFYPKLSDEDKERLRLRPVFFYDPAI